MQIIGRYIGRDANGKPQFIIISLQPVIDCLHYKRFFNSYDELIHACLSDFFQAWDAEIEYSNSFEYFADAAGANDWYFTENGEFYKGA